MVLYLSRPIILCSEPMLILIFALQLCDFLCNYFSTFQFLCTQELKEDLSYYAVPFTHCSSVCYWPSTASIAMQWWKPQTARSIWCPPTCHPSLCCLSLLLSSSCHMFPKHCHSYILKLLHFQCALLDPQALIPCRFFGPQKLCFNLIQVSINCHT